MRRILLALIVPLLVLTAPGGSAQVLELDLVSIEFDVAPETWKTRTPQEASYADDLGVWSASLGLHVDVQLDVQRASNGPEATWTYTATLTDGARTVSGYVTQDDALEVRFDVDGQRAHSGQDAIEALRPGIWRLDLEARQGERLEGRGTATFTTTGLGLERLDVPVIEIPQAMVPHVRETGPGDSIWLPLDPIASGLMATVNFPAATNVTWDVWAAVSGLAGPPTVRVPVPGVPDPFILTPLGPTDPTDAATIWLHSEVGQFEASAGTFEYEFQVPSDPTLLIFTAHTDGQMIHFLVPGRGGDFGWEEILAQPGQQGPVSVTVYGPTDMPLPADMHVISQGPDGVAPLSVSVLSPAGERVWRGVYDGITTREAGHAKIGLVAFFQDAFGGYAGHVAGIRGIDVDLDAPTLGIGRAANLDALLSHPHPQRDAGFSILADLEIQFAGPVLSTTQVDLAAGADILRSHVITPTQMGLQTASIQVDTGDLLFTVQEDFEVLDAAAYEEATAPWYDVPGPGLGLVAVGLGLLALRKREI
ncbi:MAG: hypothetical protein ACPHID_08070 [Thermoplasmatota archaeon]